jgi:hypothetical protein
LKSNNSHNKHKNLIQTTNNHNNMNEQISDVHIVANLSKWNSYFHNLQSFKLLFPFTIFLHYKKLRFFQLKNLIKKIPIVTMFNLTKLSFSTSWFELNHFWLGLFGWFFLLYYFTIEKYFNNDYIIYFKYYNTINNKINLYDFI